MTAVATALLLIAVPLAPAEAGTASNDEFQGIACPTVSICTAVGSGVNGAAAAGTTDGGATWTAETLPGAYAALASVACPSVSVCVAVGQDNEAGYAVATTDGGQQWHTLDIPALRPACTPDESCQAALNAVSCPSAADCHAVGVVTWTPAGSLLSDSIGVAIETTDAGAVWHAQTIPSNVAALNGIACPNGLHCYAAAQQNSGPGDLLTTVNGGTRWTNHFLPVADQFFGITCPTNLRCYAMGDVLVTTANGGITWSHLTVPPQVTSLFTGACPTSGDCLLTGYGAQGGDQGLVIATSNGGRTFTSQSIPNDIPALTGIACPSATTCEVVGYTTTGGAVLGTTNGGTTWTAQTTP